jgi:hypothetical protein
VKSIEIEKSFPKMKRQRDADKDQEDEYDLHAAG